MSGATSEPQVLEGTGLFSGERRRLVLERQEGPLSLGSDPDACYPLSEYRVSSHGRTTAVSRSGHEVSCVEHLFAALAAFGAYEGLRIIAPSGDLPLLDGGAQLFCQVLGELGITPVEPLLEVAREGEVDVGLSKYRFLPIERTARQVHVDLAFRDCRLEESATWEGDLASFVELIAPARTFVFLRELDALAASGTSFTASPESVAVIGPDRVFTKGKPFGSSEAARHKLLDLAGDLFAWGGPPFGRVEAFRPGHAATHHAIERALAGGLLRTRRHSRGHGP